MSGYEPYKCDSLKRLMQLCYLMAWYSGPKVLFRIEMIGQFEGHGRASETWEHDFVVELAGVGAQPEPAVVSIVYHGSKNKPTQAQYERTNSLPEGRYKSDTLEGACAKAVKAIEEWRSAS